MFSPLISLSFSFPSFFKPWLPVSNAAVSGRPRQQWLPHQVHSPVSSGLKALIQSECTQALLDEEALIRQASVFERESNRRRGRDKNQGHLGAHSPCI